MYQVEESIIMLYKFCWGLTRRTVALSNSPHYILCPEFKIFGFKWQWLTSFNVNYWCIADTKKSLNNIPCDVFRNELDGKYLIEMLALTKISALGIRGWAIIVFLVILVKEVKDFQQLTPQKYIKKLCTDSYLKFQLIGQKKWLELK